MRSVISRTIRTSYLLSIALKIFRVIFNSLQSESPGDLVFSAKELKNYRIKKVSRIVENNLYGLDKLISIKNLTLDSTYIEHGLFFGDYVQRDLNYLPNIENIVTFGNYREEILRNRFPKKNIIAVGSYLDYFESIHDLNSFNKLKEKLGSTVLVFPAHSISGMKRMYDESELINSIRDNYRNIDTIIVCLYYVDFGGARKMEFENLDCLVTTCGHKFDNQFLNRMRCLIDLSDYTVSNKMGTHVGYCIGMNKPHQFIASSYFKELALDSKGQEEIRSLHKSNNDAILIEREFNELFRERFESITEEQRRFYEKYFV